MKLKLVVSLMLGCAASAWAQGGYQDGVDYYNADRFDEAGIILNNTLNDQATDRAVSYFYLGRLDMREGKNDAAKANFDKGIQANPAYPYNYVGIGELALKAGDKKTAELNFKEAEKLSKKDAALAAAIARAYYNADPVLYAKEIQKHIDNGFKYSKYTEPSIYMLQADMKAGTEPGEAAGLYETAIQQGEDRGDRVDPAAYVKYANTYFRINPKFAIDKLLELNKKLPTSALGQRELAEKYYENNQFTMAAEQYGKYMSNPNHFQRDEQRYSGLLFFGKKYDESLKVADKVLEKDPNNLYMWRMRLYNLAELGRYEEAAQAGAHLMAMNSPELNWKDYDVYGDVLTKLGKYDEAVASYEKAVALNADKTGIYEKISEAYAKAKNYQAAAVAQQRYVDAGNQMTNDYYMLANRYFDYALTLPEGSPERAENGNLGLAAINVALEKAPENGTLWRRKAQLLQVIDPTTTPEIAQAYEKMIQSYLAEPDGAVKRASALKSGYNILANYYLNEGDKATARGYFEKILELDPENEELRNYLKNN